MIVGDRAPISPKSVGCIAALIGNAVWRVHHDSINIAERQQNVPAVAQQQPAIAYDLLAPYHWLASFLNIALRGGVGSFWGFMAGSEVLLCRQR